MFIWYYLTMLYLVSVIACWRITHLIFSEDGPAAIFSKLRSKMKGQLKELFICFACISIWCAVPFAVALSNDFWGFMLYLLAVSGGATIIEWYVDNL